MSMDEQIARATEEASSRKAIMEKVERWMMARDEERWLEEYNRVIVLISLVYLISCLQPSTIRITRSLITVCFQDENRYSVSRGAHKNLRRAERARITTNKIPGDIKKGLFMLYYHTQWEAGSFQTPECIDLTISKI